MVVEGPVMNHHDKHSQRSSSDALLSELRAAGCEVKAANSIRCCWHDDTHPSAGIFQGDDGAWRFKCHACGVAGDVFDIRARRTGKPLGEVLADERTTNGNINNNLPRMATMKISDLSTQLGVSEASLQRLNVTRVGNAWHYPERDAAGEVIGTAKRFDNGSKGFVGGGHLGLILPWPLDADAGSTETEPSLVVEGMTDTAAGLDLGFDTVGRHSNTSGADFLATLLKNRHVCIIGENDGDGADDLKRPGRIGAEKIAQELVKVCASVKIVYPPAAHKDLRRWLTAAAPVTRDDLLALIAATPRWEQVESDDATPDDGDTWPKPLGDAAYHGLAGEIVRAIEPHTEADIAALLVQLLVAYGSAAGRHSYIEADGGRHYPNLFAALVGDSSKGRKGTSWAQVRRVLEMADPDWTKDRITEGLSSGEGLIWAVHDPIIKREPIKEKGRVVEYQDIEVDPGISDKRLLVQEGELAQSLKVIQREGNTLSPILRRAWDTGTLTVLTKSNPAKATDSHIGIVGHITTHELRQLMSDTESSNGFANRFLWVCVRRSKLLPHGGQIDAVDFTGMATRLDEAIRFGQVDRRMERDMALMALWAQVYPELSSSMPGLTGKVTARSEAQVMRLALIYALLDRDDTIREIHLRAALELWRYCLDSAKVIFGWSTGDSVADRILGELRIADDGLTRNDIRDLFKRHRSSDAIQQALDTLVSHGQIVIEKIPTAGRPTEVIRLRLDLRDKRHKRQKPPGETEAPPLMALTALMAQGHPATGREVFEV
jgi:hypothetical protein